MPGWLGNGTITATMTSDQASLMPTSLDALTTLDLALIAAIAILSLVSGGLALRLQTSPQASPPDDSQDQNGTQNELQEQLKAAQAESQQSQQQLKAAQAETKDAREEAELTLLQLHQVQEELQQNAASLAEKESAAKDSSEEAELTLLQLHQVQEELEHYFLQSRGKDDLLSKHRIQQERMKLLVSRVLMKN